MNLRSDVILDLRLLLAPVDEAQKCLIDLRSAIEQAEAATSRLGNQIAELDSQAADVAAARIRPDAERVALLIAGADVPQADKKDIEARAQKARIIASQRQQLTDDLAAVRLHIGELTNRSIRAKKVYDAAEMALLNALAEAEVEAYKRAAIEFVRQQVPPLHSLAVLIAERTGVLPNWFHNTIGGNLAVRWHVPGALPRNVVNQEPAPELVSVWPRLAGPHAGNLLSGEPSYSPDVVEGLIAFIRAYEAPAPVQSDEAAGVDDTAPAGGDTAAVDPDHAAGADEAAEPLDTSIAPAPDVRAA